MCPVSLPSPETMSKVAQQTIFDSKGNPVRFGSLFDDRETIVIFIRHFFCGTCQAYVSQLASVRPEALEAANKNLIIIGCGDFQPIEIYSKNAGWTGPMYADPTRSLFHLLGMSENLKRTPEGHKKKSYLEGISLFATFSSIWKGPMKNPHHIGKNGNISQLGGEFIFGPGDQCSFASCMMHTEDHVEVSELMQEAGVEYP